MIKIIENIILIVIGLGVIYMFFIRPSMNDRAKKALKSDTVQELLNYEKITPDGLIILGNNRYRRVFEVFPTNQKIKSASEQASIWEEYRNTVDNISIDWTKIIQTRIINMKDYLESLQQKTQDIKDKYPKLYEYGERVIEELKVEYEDKQKRVRKFFIILRIDADNISDIENSISVDNAIVSALLSGNKKSKYSDEELQNIASSELENAYIQLLSGFHRSGIGISPLDKVGVLDYINTNLNRDIANIHSIDLMDKTCVLNFVPKSLTLDLFFNKNIINELNEREREQIDSADIFYYEGENINEEAI